LAERFKVLKKREKIFRDKYGFLRWMEKRKIEKRIDGAIV
jgi:hypothetical protein